MLTFWLLAGLLSVISVLALLARSTANAPSNVNRSEGALAIYKDQLKELERDEVSGAVGGTEAESQRTEISRRLLIAAREQVPSEHGKSQFPKLLVLAVPLLAVLVYWQVGNGSMGDQPRADRLARAEKILEAFRTNPNADASGLDWDATLAVVEEQQAKTPDNVQGWKFLATSYLNLGRFADAANAMAEVMRISGPTAELYADIGEALVFDNKGLLTARSVNVIEQALKLNSRQPKALYYSALNLVQEGKTAEAKGAFQNLLANAPPDAPWKAAVEAQLAKLQPSATAPQISEEQIKGGEAMSPQDQSTMIRTMVDGLDAKLKTNPQDIEGWLRLIRARTVLAETEKAAKALANARATFAMNAVNMKLLDDLATELKLK